MITNYMGAIVGGAIALVFCALILMGNWTLRMAGNGYLFGLRNIQEEPEMFNRQLVLDALLLVAGLVIFAMTVFVAIVAPTLHIDVSNNVALLVISSFTVLLAALGISGVTGLVTKVQSDAVANVMKVQGK